MTTVYGSRPSGLELKSLWSNQYWYHFPSTSAGLYLLANSMVIIIFFMYVYRIIGCKNNKTPWILGEIPPKSSPLIACEQAECAMWKGKMGVFGRR